MPLRPIKAALLTPNLSMGGAERWVATMVKFADRKRIRWTGVAVSGWGGLEPSLCSEVTNVAPLFSEAMITKTMRRNLPTPAAASPDCERYIQRVSSDQEAVRRACLGADVLIAWGSYRYRNFLSHKGMPDDFVLVSHSSHHRPHQISEVPFCRTHLVAVSEKARHPYAHRQNSPVAVIYNGVDLCRISATQDRQEIRGAWNATDNHRVIGYIGRQTVEKNPSAAIQALSALDRERWRVVYYGSEPQGHRPLKDPLLPDAKYVQFFDPVIEIGNVYHGIDVLMLASVSEAFSLTLLEGWLTKTPVVSTPVGAVPELQKKYGKLVFEVPINHTPQQLADACTAAINPANADVIERAYKLAMQEFTATAMTRRWADYLDGVIRVPTPQHLPLLDL